MSLRKRRSKIVIPLNPLLCYVGRWIFIVTAHLMLNTHTVDYDLVVSLLKDYIGHKNTCEDQIHSHGISNIAFLLIITVIS